MECFCYKDVLGHCCFKAFISSNYSDGSAHSMKIINDIFNRGIKHAIDHPKEERNDLLEYEKNGSFYKIKIRDGNMAIRILCFYDEKKLILLNSFLKPYRYNERGKEHKKVDKITKQEYKKAIFYKEDYLKNKNNRYEEL